MDFLNNLFGKKSSKNTVGKICKVEFDENGKFVSVSVPQGQWTQNLSGQCKYYSQKASSLLQAAEVLKKINSIPQYTYYVVDTPDGSLGRDINGFYTEAAIKTKNLTVETRVAKSEIVESLSLLGSGNMMANQTAVAQLKKNGQYARLVLFMKCGQCGYEFPVETLAGDLVRECYCCGATNKSHRGSINIFLGSSMVEI